MNIFSCATGRSHEHIDHNSLECPVNSDAVDFLTSLKARAAEEGINLRIASGYRGFSRQLAIWNAKARGERVVLDENGGVIDITSLSPKELLFAILRWSALPGASRHHWGTDFDVYNADKISSQDLCLVADEYRSGGPCASLYQWLKGCSGNDFYWPYDTDTGGIAPEPWHISIGALAEPYERAISQDLLYAVIQCTDIELKSSILENFGLVYERYILPGLSSGENS